MGPREVINSVRNGTGFTVRKGDELKDYLRAVSLVRRVVNERDYTTLSNMAFVLACKPDLSLYESVVLANVLKALYDDTKAWESEPQELPPATQNCLHEDRDEPYASYLP